MIKISINIEPDFYKEVRKKMKEKGFSSFSGLVRYLLVKFFEEK
jgi:hypothetical protein